MDSVLVPALADGKVDTRSDCQDQGNHPLVHKPIFLFFPLIQFSSSSLHLHPSPPDPFTVSLVLSTFAEHTLHICQTSLPSAPVLACSSLVFIMRASKALLAAVFATSAVVALNAPKGAPI